VLTADEQAFLAQMQRWASYGVDHHTLLRVAPQTFEYGWHDSPMALLAWMMQKFQQFTITVDLPEQAIDRDQILTNSRLEAINAKIRVIQRRGSGHPAPESLLAMIHRTSWRRIPVGIRDLGIAGDRADLA
jgi:transposase-like protein